MSYTTHASGHFSPGNSSRWGRFGLSPLIKRPGQPGSKRFWLLSHMLSLRLMSLSPGVLTLHMQPRMGPRQRVQVHQCFCCDGSSVYRSKIDLFENHIGFFSRSSTTKNARKTAFHDVYPYPDPISLHRRCSLVPVPSNFPKFTSLPQRFSPCHSAVAYVDLATSMATTHNYKSAGAKTQALQRGAAGSAGTPTAAATPPL